MKIVFLDEATVGALPELQLIKNFGDYTGYDYTSADQRLARVAGADVVITNKVLIDKEIIENTPSLKLICVAATGTNNVDSAAAAQRGIPVMNVAGYSTDSVVQITFSLLFELLSHTSYYNNYVQGGSYAASRSFTLIDPAFCELNGKVFGVVGMGNIGKKVAAVASAFGAQVVYYSTSGKNNVPGYRQVSLDELLEQCDIISIHAPLNDTTRDLFDYSRLSKMKSTAFILNLGRGGIINEAGLVRALNECKIAGAGIDVFTKEPIAADSPYLSLADKSRLVATPHIAWASVEARKRLIAMIADNIRRWQQSQRS